MPYTCTFEYSISVLEFGIFVKAINFKGDMASDDNDCLFKIVLIGDSEVGKSNLLSVHAQPVQYGLADYDRCGIRDAHDQGREQDDQGADMGHRRPGALPCHYGVLSRGRWAFSCTISRTTGRASTLSTG